MWDNIEEKIFVKFHDFYIVCYNGLFRKNISIKEMIGQSCIQNGYGREKVKLFINKKKYFFKIYIYFILYINYLQ